MYFNNTHPSLTFTGFLFSILYIYIILIIWDLCFDWEESLFLSMIIFSL